MHVIRVKKQKLTRKTEIPPYFLDFSYNSEAFYVIAHRRRSFSNWIMVHFIGQYWAPTARNAQIKCISHLKRCGGCNKRQRFRSLQTTATRNHWHDGINQQSAYAHLGDLLLLDEWRKILKNKTSLINKTWFVSFSFESLSSAEKMVAVWIRYGFCYLLQFVISPVLGKLFIIINEKTKKMSHDERNTQINLMYFEERFTLSEFLLSLAYF